MTKYRALQNTSGKEVYKHDVIWGSNEVMYEEDNILTYNEDSILTNFEIGQFNSFKLLTTKHKFY